MSSYNLTGSGTQVMSSNVTAVHVTINTPASAASIGRATPDSYYDVALLRFGDGTGYWSPVAINGGPQWIAVPAGTTIVGYNVFGAISLTLTEVIGGTPPFGAPTLSLEQLTDVSVAGVSDGQLIAWNAGASKWENVTPSSGGPATGTVILGANAASIRLPAAGSFAGTGHHLRIVAQVRGANASNNLELYLQLNGDTAAHYQWLWGRHESGNVTNASDSGGLVARMDLGGVPADSAVANSAGPVQIVIPNYAGTTFWKQALARAGFMANADGSGNDWQEYLSMHQWESTAAVTFVTLLMSAGDLKAGSMASYYEDA